MVGNEQEFLNYMYEEKKKIIEERSNHINRKLLIIASFSGIGSLGKYENIQFYPILFLLPLIILSYDLYINASDLRIKKWGSFVRNKDNQDFFSKIEVAWEKYMPQKRVIHAPLANLTITICTIFASNAILLYYLGCNPQYCIILLIWTCLLILLSIVLHGYHHISVKKLDAE